MPHDAILPTSVSNKVSPDSPRATYQLSPRHSLPQEMNIFLKALRLPKRHMPLLTLPPNTQHNRLPHARAFLLLDLLDDRAIRMSQIALHIGDSIRHEFLDIREEELLGAEEGCYLDYGSGAENSRREGFGSKVEEVRCFGQKRAEGSGEGSIARGGYELLVVFDTVPIFDLVRWLAASKIRVR